MGKAREAGEGAEEGEEGEDGKPADVETLAAAAAEQWTAGFNPRRVTPTDLARLYEAAA